MPSFYNPEFNVKDKYITLQGDENHHLVHVMRKKTGEAIDILNGKGITAHCIIESTSKKQTKCKVSSIQESFRSKSRISTAFALLKNKNDHLIIEKLTELGVSEFYPLVTDRTIKRPKDSVVKKFYSTAMTAVKQCDNPFIPVIHETLDLKDFIKKITSTNTQLIIASESEEKIYLKDIELDNNVCIIIGPEGGFSESERTFFKEGNLLTVSLGSHILRAETAAISFTSQLINMIQSNGEIFF